MMTRKKFYMGSAKKFLLDDECMNTCQDGTGEWRAIFAAAPTAAASNRSTSSARRRRIWWKIFSILFFTVARRRFTKNITKDRKKSTWRRKVNGSTSPRAAAARTLNYANSTSHQHAVLELIRLDRRRHDFFGFAFVAKLSFRFLLRICRPKYSQRY